MNHVTKRCYNFKIGFDLVSVSFLRGSPLIMNLFFSLLYEMAFLL